MRIETKILMVSALWLSSYASSYACDLEDRDFIGFPAEYSDDAIRGATYIDNSFSAEDRSTQGYSEVTSQTTFETQTFVTNAFVDGLSTRCYSIIGGEMLSEVNDMDGNSIVLEPTSLLPLFAAFDELEDKGIYKIDYAENLRVDLIAPANEEGFPGMKVFFVASSEQLGLDGQIQNTPAFGVAYLKKMPIEYSWGMGSPEWQMDGELEIITAMATPIMMDVP